MTPVLEIDTSMPTPEQGAITVVFCDVRKAKADAQTVDALARLQLVAGRHRCQVRLRGPSPELCELVAFMGLREFLPDSGH